MADQMKLYVFTGDEYSPSVDPESLQILTYIRLARSSSTGGEWPPSSLQIISTCKSWQSPSGILPTLMVGNKVYVGSEKVITELKNQGLKIQGEELEPEERLVDTTAYTALLKDRLRLALLYVHWIDSKNYTDISCQWYGKASSFPMSQYLLSRQRRHVEHEVNATLAEEVNLEHRGITLISEAEDCLTSLSHRLNNNRYFNGSSPSTLDAMVFGYLNIICQYPLPGNNKLQLHLNSLKGLSNFTDRIKEMAFPEIKTKHPMVPSGLLAHSGPLWKDPTVWACLFLGGALITVQGIRIGLLQRLANRIIN